MKFLVIRLVESFFKIFVRAISKGPLWFPFSSSAIVELRQRTSTVGSMAEPLIFHTPNDRCLFRANSLFTKEPETIEWIDSFAENSVFWDVGACVGTYSIYAAARKKVRVIAVEPSVFNLEWLAKNVNANALAHRVTIVPLALSTNAQIANFNMQVTEWGGALSSFGVDYNHEGEEFVPKFIFSTIGCSVEFLVEKFELPQPDYIKIDVDSIEHLVLHGMGSTIRAVKSVALENSRNDQVRQACVEFLLASGFVITHVGRANTIWSQNDVVVSHS